MLFDSNFTLAELHEAATDNLVEFYRFFSRYVDGAENLDEPGVFAAATGIPDEMLNGVFRTRLTTETADDCINRAIALFERKKTAFQWWLGPNDTPSDLAGRLEQRGFACGFELPGMAIEIDQAVVSPPAGPIEIRRVANRAEMEEWLQTVIAACGMPEEVGPPYLNAQDRIGYGTISHLRDYAGYVDGRIVATTTVHMAAGVAAIYCVGTLEGERRNGFASTLVHRALSEARECGYRYGVLQSSSKGRSVYERLGFKLTGHYGIYKRITVEQGERAS
jgi:GNAT superfamily N-acetyltransferase